VQEILWHAESVGRIDISHHELQEPKTIVVGQGLAGTAVAWALHRRGQKFVVVDPGKEGVASHIAAGLITPVAGKRFAVAPHFNSLFQRASEFYADIEKELQAEFFLSQPALRLCHTDEEVELFEKRAEALIKAGQIRMCSNEELLPFRRNALGFLMPNAARLMTKIYLEKSRRYFESQNQLVASSVNTEEIDVVQDRVSISSLGLRASRVIFCRGYMDELNPWLPGNVFNSAKGEVLNVKIEGYENPRTIHAFKSWLCPTSDASVYSFGATYEHGGFKQCTTRQAREVLKQRLGGIIALPFTIEDQQYGVRPIGIQRKAIVGRHGQHANVAWLNGLGSKGALLAPYLASELVEALLADRAINIDLTEAHVSG